MKSRALLLWGGGCLGAVIGLSFFLSSWKKGKCQVTGAGSAVVNGYYIGVDDVYRQPSPGQIKWLPDVFQAPYIVDKMRYSKPVISVDQGVWLMGMPPSSVLYSAPQTNKVVQAPPKEGWEPVGGQSPAPILSHISPLSSMEPSESYKRLNDQVKLAYQRPGTTMLIIINLIAAYRLWANRTPVDQISFSYTAVVDSHEYWRMVTASFAHVDFLHLLFNMVSIYNLGALEDYYGTMSFFTLSLELVVLTMAMNIIIIFFLGKVLRRERHLVQQSIGYSCVLFAWIVAAAVLSKEYCPIPGLTKLCFSTYNLPDPVKFPINLAPFALLIVTHFIMPRASFIGHLSGIILGYPLAWGLLAHIPLTLLASIMVLVILTHERLWPCQAYLLPPVPNGRPADKPPSALVKPFIIVLVLQALVSFISFVGLHPAFFAEHLILSMAGASALWVFPSGDSRSCLNVLYYYLSLNCLQTVVDAMSLGGVSARSALYHQMGAGKGAVVGSLVTLTFALGLGCAAIITTLRVIHSYREGYSSLQALGIELDAVQTMGSTTNAFSGVGHTLGLRTSEHGAFQPLSGSGRNLRNSDEGIV